MSERPRTRVGVISLGCAKNLVDTEVMLGHLDRAGGRLVTDPAEAEVVVVNTCGFIDAAREESVRTILEAASWKREGRVRRLVVAGCLVQRYRDELAAELPEVDAFIGLDELDRVVGGAGLAGSAEAAPSALRVLPPSTYLYDDATPRRLATPGFRAYVKIAEGCDHTCAFCAIPGFRGSFRSRSLESVVRETARLVAGGVREINLIAQDSSHYGRDLGRSEGLAELLRALDAVDGLRWIRVHYLYPNTITAALIDALAGLPRVVPYVDLPLQHAHPQTLRRMRRGGSAETHFELIERLRRAIPDAALRTTFIVGFPGETDEEFAALLDFVERARFDHVGAFVYSHEEGTPAAALEDDVPPAVKRRRRDRLMRVQQPIAFAASAARVGRREIVLVEGPHPETEHLLVGRTARQAPEVDGQVLINDGIAAPGSFVEVEMTEAAGYDLVGRVVGTA